MSIINIRTKSLDYPNIDACFFLRFPYSRLLRVLIRLNMSGYDLPDTNLIAFDAIS